MKTMQIKFIPEAGFCTPLRADVLFGQILWQVRYLWGEEELYRLLEQFRAGNVPFVVSDAMPEDYLPKPVHLPAERVEGDLNEVAARKKLKKVEWIKLQDYLAYVAGNELNLNVLEPVLVETEEMHNTINRLTGTTGTEGSLYSSEAYYFNHQCYEYLSFYLRSNAEWLDRFPEILDSLELTGLGKGKARGYGQFHLIGWDNCEWLDEIEGADAMLLGNAFVPSASDPVEGYWRVETKFGRTGENISSFPFKKPMTMLARGTVLKGSYRPYVGKLLTDIHHDPRIVHSGYGFTFPWRWVD
ncbi:hypothetical protein [Carboxydocella sp. JDF658]|uniref:type III-A CRISPR-associated RAMP protein Csm4 n=1 Tax=Carboxydocella sp. JDF658 TaxID=1926600 RepID=UPI0009ADFB68|nr:hypothetical protein [Carboxydocella sp. JDF658]GAW32207.1 hypothetical protein JDF658_19720 [Carboxydocella sp. JDF658]